MPKTRGIVMAGHGASKTRVDALLPGHPRLLAGFNA
jgi:hypothetical protein